MSSAPIPNGRSSGENVRVAVRPFQHCESQEVVDLINECMQADHFDDRVGLTTWMPGLLQVSSMSQQYGVVAETSGQMVGAAWLERATGARVICHLFVRPNWRQSAAAQELLRASFANSFAYPERTFDLPLTPNEPYKLALSQAYGFGYVRSWWRVAVALTNLTQPRMPADSTVRIFVPGQDEALLTDMINSAFSQHWGEGRHSAEQVTDTVSHPAFRPELVFFLMLAGQPVGYSWSWIDHAKIAALGENRAYISDLGIIETHRGQGLGRTLLLHTLRELQQREMVVAHLDVDGPNLPARQLYRSVGFVDVLEQRWYRHTMAAPAK